MSKRTLVTYHESKNWHLEIQRSASGRKDIAITISHEENAWGVEPAYRELTIFVCNAPEVLAPLFEWLNDEGSAYGRV